MSKAKQLSKKQLAVIDGLFTGELDEQAILNKYNVTNHIYNKWFSDERFCEEFVRRMERARLQSAALIAKYSIIAAAKLVQLTESEKAETARKACLDIISLPKSQQRQPASSNETQGIADKEVAQLSDGAVSRLLTVLAEEKKKEKQILRWKKERRRPVFISHLFVRAASLNE